MATRSSTRAIASASASPAPPRRLAIAEPAATASPQLVELRRQWKWAAFSQFFHTFAQLIALDDVTLVDIEEDLVNSTTIVIPRLMQRLLVTLSQDRKITVANWQSALRRQYLRRDPAANPIGIEPVISRNSRAATVEAEIKSEERDSSWMDDVPTMEADQQDKPTDETNIAEVADESDTKEPRVTHTVDERRHASRHTSVGLLKGNEEGESAQNTQGSTKDWAELSMLEKLESMHTLTEWHFQSPLRLRSTMRSDDDNASWRIEPVGYDAKRNAYWLIGLDRLWIQRVPQKPPKKSGKRKVASNDETRKTKTRRIERAEEAEQMEVDASDTSQAASARVASTSHRTRRGSRQPSTVTNTLSSSPQTNGRARAAKTQANVKLDLQAKQLAAARAEMESLSRRTMGRSSPAKASSCQAHGTRASRRLRGRRDDGDDDEWQEIPEEWLPKGEEVTPKPVTSAMNGSGARASTRIKIPPRPKKEDIRFTARGRVARDAGLESDGESDLTELSDSELSNHRDDTIRAGMRESVVADTPKHKNAEMGDQSSMDAPQTPDFVEWETLCVSLEEWEAISDRFEKATHYLEKALHKVLAQEIVPFVTSTLREIEKQRNKEDALMHRKRSSRIAIKDMEKEAERLAAARQAEEDEKMARMRRLEARTRREEEERLRREQARERRRKEREEREVARSRRSERDSSEVFADALAKPESNVAVNAQNDSLGSSSKSSRRRMSAKASKQGTSGDNWELDCEVCGSKGINKDDGVALMSCGKCSKWQHIPCHDVIDRKAGRPLRNWDVVDFFCRRCLASKRGSVTPYAVQTSRAPPENNARERHFGSRSMTSSPMNGFSASTNDAVAFPVVNKMPPLQQQPSPGSTAFTGFAHYHPQQRGFSPHPSVLHSQHHPQTHVLAGPSFPAAAGRGIPTAWDSRAQDSSHSNQGLERSAYQLPSFPPSHSTPSRAPNGQFSDLQQTYTALNDSVPYHPAQTGPSSQPYYSPPQQKTCSNPASHHP